MRPLRPALASLLAVSALLLAAGALLLAATPALASHNQISILEDDAHLMAHPVDTLNRLHLMGVDTIRLDIKWDQVAPAPHSHRRPRFNAANPAAYPSGAWAIYDKIIEYAQQQGMQVDLDLNGGAPIWATGRGAPKVGGQHPQWEPSASQFGLFVRAAGTRYDGGYIPPGASQPLPAINFWSIWNEPNLGFQLAPQGVPGNLQIENSGRMYRALLNAGWNALHQTGHGSDTILIGETAPRGAPTGFGVFAAMKPLEFLRALYCVDSHYNQLRGNAARIRGCPTTAGASRRFRAQNPALFGASGWAQHMHMRWYPPDVEGTGDPNNASLAQIPGLEHALDRAQRAYGSSKRLQIYNTEFGYITSPPNGPPFVSPTKAAYYLNWAEYISWRDPRVASFDQYLLSDPRKTRTNGGGWSSGLLTYRQYPKPAYAAWQLPLYLPVGTTRRGRSVEVWGCARPADVAAADTGEPQTVNIQFQPFSGGPFITLQQVSITNPQGYFDTRVTFPSTGTVRLSWTYPSDDPLLDPGVTVYSRNSHVTVQ